MVGQHTRRTALSLRLQEIRGRVPMLEKMYEHPWQTLLIVMSVAMLIFGLYLISPWYPVAPAISSAVFAQVFAATYERAFLGAFYIGVPLFTLGSILASNNKLTRAGALGLWMIYLFAALLRLITVGWTPLNWLFILACGLVCLMARVQLR